MRKLLQKNVDSVRKTVKPVKGHIKGWRWRDLGSVRSRLLAVLAQRQWSQASHSSVAYQRMH